MQGGADKKDSVTKGVTPTGQRNDFAITEDRSLPLLLAKQLNHRFPLG
jgi:hypothetical protein